MADVFISYCHHSSQDRTRAQALADRLTACGVSVWWDYDLVGGARFRKAILDKLTQARAVAVIWSPNSVQSHFVEDEAERARAMQKLVPLRTPDLSVDQIPLGFGAYQTLVVDDLERILGALSSLGVEAHANLKLDAVGAGVTWKNGESGCVLRVGDWPIPTTEISGIWSGSDFLVHHTTSDALYLLPSMLNLRDDKWRPADTSPGITRAVWKSTGAGFWVRANGHYLPFTPGTWCGTDLLIFDPTTSSHYLLNDMKSNSDGQWRLADESPGKTRAVWKADLSQFSFRIDNKYLQSDEMLDTWIGRDYLIVHKSTDVAYLLKNMMDLKDNQWRLAETIGHLPSHPVMTGQI